jgi:hypothetical protein
MAKSLTAPQLVVLRQGHAVVVGFDENGLEQVGSEEWQVSVT